MTDVCIKHNAFGPNVRFLGEQYFFYSLCGDLKMTQISRKCDKTFLLGGQPQCWKAHQATTLAKSIMTDTDSDIVYADYTDESMLPDIQRLVSRDLSEPYSVYTYRYFLHNCPRFCICAYAKDNKDPSKRTMIATVVCKLEGEGEAMHGYMAMLAVDKEYRKRGIAKKLVTMVIDRMVEDGCREVMLEAEVGCTAIDAVVGLCGKR